jgi:hypothetical protein
MTQGTEEIRLAISKHTALEKSLKYLRESVPSSFTPNAQMKFSASEDAKCMEVHLSFFDLTARAIGRKVWVGRVWKFEYVFYVGEGESRVEVFRFYLNDEGAIENHEGELFGSPEGGYFLDYVCQQVFLGALNSSLFAVSEV